MSQFDNLSLDELISAQEEIQKLIKTRQKEAKNNLLKEFREKAESLGLDFDDLVGSGKKKSSGGKVPAKYRNPTDSAETWTGRGRKPKWLESELNMGRSLEDFLI